MWSNSYIFLYSIVHQEQLSVYFGKLLEHGLFYMLNSSLHFQVEGCGGTTYFATNTTKWITKMLQFQLKAKGYNVTIDGVWGTKTTAAINKFRKKCNKKHLVKADFLRYNRIAKGAVTSPPFLFSHILFLLFS